MYIEIPMRSLVRIHNKFVRSLNTYSAGCDIPEGHGFNIHRNDGLGGIKLSSIKDFITLEDPI
jgi:hypothetical protein